MVSAARQARLRATAITNNRLAPIAALLPPSVGLAMSSNQSISNAAFTDVTWASATWDSGGMLWQARDPTYAVVRTLPAVYTMDVLADFASNATGNRYVRIVRIDALDNSETILRETNNGAVSGDVTFVTCSVTYPLAINDKIVVRVYQDSGGPLNLLAVDTRFSMTCVRQKPT